MKVFNPNEPLYLVAGGPSLTDFDFSLLYDKQVIAINRAFEKLPNALIVYWMDEQFYSWFKEDLKYFKGIQVAGKYNSLYPEDVHYIFNPNITDKTDALRFGRGNNSGFGALQLAIALKAKDIRLLGYDMTWTKGQNHWHSGYERPTNSNIYTRFNASFLPLSEHCKKYNISVVNYNLESKLKYFPKQNLLKWNE